MNNKKFVTNKYELWDERIKGSCRIAFLTDLHSEIYGDNQAELVGAIKREKPDYIFIGGDMMAVKPYIRMNMEPLEQLFRGLQGVCPIYYAYGNHEQRMKTYKNIYPGCYRQFLQLLKKYKVRLLVNRTARFRNGMAVSGIFIPYHFYKKKLFPAFSDKITSDSTMENWVGERVPDIENAKADGYYNILLAHTPNPMEDYWKYGADLVLCGHYHGGIMRLPRNRVAISPQFTFFAGRGWGMYSRKANPAQKGITSTGLGNHSINIRINVPTELVIIDWNK